MTDPHQLLFSSIIETRTGRTANLSTWTLDYGGVECNVREPLWREGVKLRPMLPVHLEHRRISFLINLMPLWLPSNTEHGKILTLRPEAFCLPVGKLFNTVL